MEEHRRRKFKLNLKFVKLIIIIFSLILLSLLCYTGYKKHTGKEYINYNETNILEYIVCYVEPNELNQGCLSSDINNYVTKYINDIKVNFNYKLNWNKKVDTNYKYKIIGELTIFDRNNHSLIMEKKEYVLLEEKQLVKEDIETLTANELISLNYIEYDRYVTNYKNNATMLAGANIKIIFHIESINKHNDVSQELKVNNDIILNIPLGEPTIQLNTNYVPNNQSPNIKIVTTQTPINIILGVLSVLFGLIAIILIIYVIRVIYKDYKSLPLYSRLIKSLKNDFDYEISEISSLIDTENEDRYKYFDAISFKELYDLVKTSIEKKILWNEKQYFDKKGRLENRISWFFVFMSDNKVMRFVVDENKLNEEYERDPNVLKKYRG